MSTGPCLLPLIRKQCAHGVFMVRECRRGGWHTAHGGAGMRREAVMSVCVGGGGGGGCHLLGASALGAPAAGSCVWLAAMKARTLPATSVVTCQKGGGGCGGVGSSCRVLPNHTHQLLVVSSRPLTHRPTPPSEIPANPRAGRAPSPPPITLCIHSPGRAQTFQPPQLPQTTVQLPALCIVAPVHPIHALIPTHLALASDQMHPPSLHSMRPSLSPP